MSRALGALAVVALLVVLAASPEPSGANFHAVSANKPNQFSADSAANYLHLFSQSTDPAGLTGYAVKQFSNPQVLAATGIDTSLALDLGGWKNGGTMNRVLTIQAVNPLPAAAITVTATVPISPTQPVSVATFAAVGSTGGTPSVTLTAGAKRQLNLTIAKLPGNNLLYNTTILITVTYPGYAGDFLTYTVPVKAWDGNGSGP